MLYYFLRASIWEAFLMGERRKMTVTVSYIKSFDFSILQHCEELALSRANDKVRRNYNHVGQVFVIARKATVKHLNDKNCSLVYQKAVHCLLPQTKQLYKNKSVHATSKNNTTKKVPWPSWLRRGANNAKISSSILLGTTSFRACGVVGSAFP